MKFLVILDPFSKENGESADRAFLNSLVTGVVSKATVPSGRSRLSTEIDVVDV